ncbi:DUF4277 domain-containing protein, partial [Alicyclobacillus fructus]|uniref:DUF4277 domain-containing protein n=1 Tax=Alicyclobacillus fructus TaxID=2816082 RepID=UPI001F455F28
MFGPVRSYVMGPAPVLARLIDELKWVEIIDEFVPRPDSKLSVGLRTKALLVNIGTNREALYRVEEFYAQRDVEVLLGSGVSADDRECKMNCVNSPDSSLGVYMGSEAKWKLRDSSFL